MSAITTSASSGLPHAKPRLRIAIVAPPWFEVPPQGYGGTEAVVAGLVDQLEQRGHEVTLVGAGEHRTQASHFVQVYPSPPSHQLGRSAMPEVITAAEASRALSSLALDVIHDHSLAGPLLARNRTVPTLATVHGLATGENGDYFHRLEDTVGLIGISDAQRLSAPTLNWVGRVYNGIDVASFPFKELKEDYLLWIGRFDPSKGAHLAIAAARETGRRLVLAGKLNEEAEKSYFESVVAPSLGENIEYVGEAGADLKRELYANAACLLFPIQWHEPFGMVMAEAMACGTPVVATRYGSVPELVDDGVTGIIVDDAADLPAAIAAVDRIDPLACRTRAEQNFDISVMAAEYEKVYYRVAKL